MYLEAKKRRSKREVGERSHPSAIVQEETEQNRKTHRAAGGGGGARGICCVCVCVKIHCMNL